MLFQIKVEQRYSYTIPMLRCIAYTLLYRKIVSQPREKERATNSKEEKKRLERHIRLMVQPQWRGGHRCVFDDDVLPGVFSSGSLIDT